MKGLSVEDNVVGERMKRKALALGSGDVDAVVVTGDAHRSIVETATAMAADLIVMGVAPRTWIDEAAFGSTLRTVLRGAKIPVLVLPVVGEAHDWMDDVNREDAFNIRSSADAMVRRVA